MNEKFTTIKSDGTGYSTKITTADGSRVENFKSVTWHVDAEKQIATATVELLLAKCDLSGEGHFLIRNPRTGNLISISGVVDEDGNVVSFKS